MADTTCPKRQYLSHTVTLAIQAVYTANNEHVLAMKEKRDSGPLMMLLAAARKAERQAVRDLDSHRKEHKC